MNYLVGKTMFKSLCLAFAMSVSVAAWGETIIADFESGSIPDGWTSTGVTVKKDNNSNRAAMSTNATLVTPDVSGLRSVAYRHRGSGSNKELVVDASADGGVTWQTIGNTTVNSSSTYGSSSHSVTSSDGAPVRVRFTCKSATIYLDDIELTYVLLASEPRIVSVLNGTGCTGSSVSASITKGDGVGRLVAITEGETMTWMPEDGTAYTGTFPKKVGDVTILDSGDISSVTATGLNPGTKYTLGVFEYNGDGDQRNYLTAGASTITLSTLTIPTFTFSPSTLDFMKTKVGGGKERTLTVTGKYLDPVAGAVSVVSSSDEVTLSLDGVTYSSQVAMDYSSGCLEGVLTVRFTPTAHGERTGVITFNGGGAESAVTVKAIGADNDNHEYFIAPDGDDTAAGTIDAPWLNLQKAVNAAEPGDIIYCRGGRYHFTTRDGSGKLTVRIRNSGSADAPITITAYADEHPIFDFEQQLLDCNRDRSKVGDRGILLTGNYWHLYGLHIMHAADNGIKLEGSHNTIERCEFSYNLDSGLQMGFGHNFADSGLGLHNDGSFCAYNTIIDCDSHHNCDYDANYGSDADGFACKMHNGKGNRFIRCRAWRNGDDAWDLYETDFSVTLVECWAWESGKAEDHTWVYEYFDKGPGFSGNGNGIKLGGNGSGGSSRGVHYAYNCVAFGNNKSGSTKGFDCNSHKDGHVVVGGLAFDNGYDFMFESGGGANSEFYNNVCFGRQEILVGTESHNALGVTPQQGKTFFNNVVTGFSRSDYESLSEADALAPRGEDGSLPVKFARLKSGSRLVDAGIYKPVPIADEYSFLEQPVYGASRDIGPYELQEGDVSSIAQMITDPAAGDTFAITCSGRVDELIATVSVGHVSSPVIEVYTIAGAAVTRLPLGRLENGAVYTFPVAVGQLIPGVYIATLQLDGKTLPAKFVVR